LHQEAHGGGEGVQLAFLPKWVWLQQHVRDTTGIPSQKSLSPRWYTNNPTQSGSYGLLVALLT
jgi:hypothetical protein